MVYKSNNEKILDAVLSDERLMQYGGYTESDFCTMASALDSDNCTVKAVALIIKRMSEGVEERELWKEINNYLKANID